MAYLLLHWVKTDYLHTFIRLFLSYINVNCEIKMWTTQHTINYLHDWWWRILSKPIYHAQPSQSLKSFLQNIYQLLEKICINAIRLLIITDWINLLCDFHHTYQIINNMKCSFRQIFTKQSLDVQNACYPVCIDKSTFVSLYNVYCILVPKKCIC